ncbi:MAG: lipoprotein [Cuspidothrix sp.]
MKKIIPTIAVIFTCISLIGCGNTPKETIKEDASNTVKQSQTEISPVVATETEDEEESSSKTETKEEENNPESKKTLVRKNVDSNKNQKKEGKKPKVGTVKELVNGDLMCYVTLVDKKGTEHNLGATFEICEQDKKFVDKKVRLVYETQSVNDCESAEPCGKTRKESIITKMELISEDREKESVNDNSKSSNSQTLSNGEWTITLSNTDSWKGVNGTGDVSYKGCDANGKCLDLTGGKVTCRDGKCITGWTNGDYVYILEQPITEKSDATATLIVRQNTKEILKATDLKVVSGN